MRSLLFDNFSKRRFETPLFRRGFPRAKRMSLPPEKSTSLSACILFGGFAPVREISGQRVFFPGAFFGRERGPQMTLMTPISAGTGFARSHEAAKRHEKTRWPTGGNESDSPASRATLQGDFKTQPPNTNPIPLCGLTPLRLCVKSSYSPCSRPYVPVSSGGLTCGGTFPLFLLMSPGFHTAVQDVSVFNTIAKLLILAQIVMRTDFLGLKGV